MSTTHKTCYGTMFPDVLRPKKDETIKGTVFDYTLTTAGGTCTGDRRVSVNTDAWDSCRQCPEFQDCYALSLAKLSLAAAITHW